MKKILIAAALLSAMLALLVIGASAACDHNWIIDFQKCVAPTCSAAGKNVYTCSRCSLTKTDTITKLEHDYVRQSGDYATCTTDSTVVEKCSVCGTERNDPTKAKGHSYVETNRVAATCAKAGTITYRCAVCSHIKTEEIPTTAHDFSKFISSSATCTTRGQSTYQCSMCPELTLITESSLGHNLVTSGGPTCTEAGAFTYSCSRCTYTRTSGTQRALGHELPDDEDDWTIISKATCGQEGEIRARCSRCYEYVIETVESLDHEFGDGRYVTKLPTSVTSGTYVRICENCGETLEKTISRGTTNLGSYTIANVKSEPESGMITRGAKVELYCDLDDVKIFYAVDGKSPLSSSSRLTYTEPIAVNQTTVIKAYAVYDGDDDIEIEPSDVTTFTFVIDKNDPWVTLVSDASDGGYMTLDKNSKFRPNDKATRYEVIEALDELFDSMAADAETTFTDVDVKHQAMVAKFVGAGLLNGYEDGTFRGTANIKRSELCKVIAIALGIEVKANTLLKFPDVAITHWAYSYIAALTSKGYLAGDTSGNFRPEDNITRAELVVLLNRIAEIGTGDGVKISDVDDEHWAYGYICAAVQEKK